MPTRKQRRREAKAKRHEYEFVYVDDEGNEVEPPPEALATETPARDERRNGKPAAQGKQEKQKQQPQQRGGRRAPPEPSWNRAFKRGGLLGIVVFVLFAFTAKGHWVNVIPLAVIYTALFVPFTFYIDRMAYRRYLKRRESEAETRAAKRPTKKR